MTWFLLACRPGGHQTAGRSGATGSCAASPVERPSVTSRRRSAARGGAPRSPGLSGCRGRGGDTPPRPPGRSSAGWTHAGFRSSRHTSTRNTPPPQRWPGGRRRSPAT